VKESHLRIAITGQTYLPGNNGQAIFTIHLAEGLARVGHEVHVIMPSERFFYRHEMINGVHLHTVRSLNFDWVHPGSYYTFVPGDQIRRIFREHRPDIVHLQDHYFLSIDVTAAARKMDIPIVGTNHFLPENLLPYLNFVPLPRSKKISILWDLMLWTYNHLEIVTTPTETAASILRRQKITAPVVPISCGVNTGQFHPAPELDRVNACANFGLDANQPLLFYVGRLDAEKRIDLLLRGLASLRARGRDDIRLAIAGQGAAGNDLRTLASTLGLAERVRFLGYVPNEQLPLLYQTGQVFCMPSPEELQSIATLEAMASGRPVLAANARALPELVTHGENGYLFAPGQIEAAADGMAYLVDHREEWHRMGQASRARAVTHSLDNTIQRYEEVYRKAIECRCKLKNGKSCGKTPN
jgi:1,2-diacylglycerol 3-alpha-glucosyltransferase